MLIDIHAKSSRSPGTKFSADQIAKNAADAGFDGVAFCETLSTAHCKEALAACKKHKIQGFIGVEIPTTRGILLGFAPSIDDFYLAEEWRRVTEVTTPPAEVVISMFQEIGGVVVAARPYDLSIPHNMGDNIFRMDGICAVEVFNTRAKQLQCDFAIEAAAFMNVPTVGGTDPSGDAAALGRYGTFFESKLTKQEDLVEALLGGRCWAVQLGNSPKPKPRPRRDDRGDRGGRSGGRGGSKGGRRDDRKGGRGGGRGGRSGGNKGGGRSGGRGGNRS